MYNLSSYIHIATFKHVEKLKRWKPWKLTEIMLCDRVYIQRPYKPVDIAYFVTES